jgi:4-hydroxyacetophenone monooxygenase
MSGGNQATRPITESDEELAAIVDQLSPVLLAVSAVHMSGSLDILRGVTRPKEPLFMGDQSGSLPPEDAALIRARALPIIKAWRDAGYPEPYFPTDTELHEMLNFLAGMDLPNDYVTMAIEDMAMRGDAREFHWTRPVSAPTREHYPVIVIGAGMSGMLMGLRLKQAGLPFTIIEKNDSVGGTWFENQYPGLRVDVPSQSYSFSFLQEHRWPHLYSFQSDLLAYFRKCADAFDISDHIRHGLEVIQAVYDEETQDWAVTVRDRKGVSETLRAKAVVSAVGLFNKPQVPAFKDAGKFKGPAFHTAQWRHDVDLKGKRVIVIGNAATAFQMIPELVKIVDKLIVFQRSPGWSFLHPEYERPITRLEDWATDHLPYWSGWTRAIVFNWAFDFRPDHMKVDPAWPQDGRAVSAANDYMRVLMTDAMTEAFRDRPDLLPKVIPTYPPFVKRPTVSNGSYYRAIQAPNCELVTEAIDRFTENGIIDATGKLHEADAIIYATGFQVQNFLTPMTIRGRGGQTLNQYWADRPGGYLGMAVPHFPSFFMMYGPGTNLGYNGNLIYNSELQSRYIAHCIRFMVEDGREALEVKESAFEDYMEKTGEKLQEFVWSTDYGTTYFRNAAGKVTTNSPWSLYEMWKWSLGPVPEDFLDDPAGGTRTEAAE